MTAAAHVHGDDGAIFHLMRRVLQGHTALWSAQLPGLTKTQWTVLREVVAHPGQDLGTVGARVAIDKATLTPLVARMVDRGWLLYLADPDDRRRRLLVATNEGRSTEQHATPLVREVDDSALQALEPAQRDQLRGLLARLA
ncbi:MarR family winged helix-turn-helix transcriptional regulator [Klenkia brasiliensis]|uniref:MarR family winged helix-turn-helix transcriptional regulator n=1 Tax=Klenkia brasiliensis TaxID=333142 RepID=UPI0013F69A43|nr:MarR family winged helix-turn-helix transcriptional regulator [Klenkia brasiliensis]